MRVSVDLIATSSVMPVELATVDARTCYSPDPVELGEVMGLEKSVFTTGHHTTLMVPEYVFRIENVSVSTVTEGLHLAFPFYNSGQRSGRFCGEMFDTLDVASFAAKLNAYRYDGEALDPRLVAQIIEFIRFGVDIFKSRRIKATRLVSKLIGEDRSRAPVGYIEANARKIAQEQLRVFISTIAPTGMIYKINLVGLAALHRTAHTPEMQDVVSQMVLLVCQHDPRVRFMFLDPGFVGQAIPINTKLSGGDIIWTEPRATLGKFDRWPKGCPIPTQQDLHPVDILHADPRFMPLATRNIQSQVTLSLMTMGQDQRHRTIARGKPMFTGAFYSPPIVELLGLHEQAREFMERWLAIAAVAPPEVSNLVAPYGAMVKYDKSGDYRALIHEQNKRTCWCAQAEIFELARQIREQFIARDPMNPIISIMAPRCFGGDMKCGEGKRYCGRAISLQDFSSVEYFAPRRI